MICDVCGHANADRLTFCQECGRRLKSREARVVAPTPPQGMPKVVLPPAAAAPASPAPAAPAPAAALPFVPAPPPVPQAPPPAARPSSRSRPDSGPPPAPVSPVPAGKTKDPSEPAGASGAAPVSTSAVTCPTCGTSNPAMYRFCVACGVTLPRDAGKPSATTPPIEPAPAAAPAPAPVDRAPSPVPVERAAAPVPVERAAAPIAPAPAAPAASPAPAAVAPAAAPAAPPAAVAAAPQARQEERIIGAPVVEIAPGGAPQKPIVCPRCGGQCIPTARFCQFCGATLGGDGRPASLAARLELDEGRSAGRDAGIHAAQPVVVAHGRAHTSQSRGRLVVIEADGSEGMTFTLTDRQLDIGRTEGDILVKEDPYVSPRHARLVPDGGRWLVRDLASTNGVYLRVKKPYPLQDADLLLLGQEVLQFQLVSEPEKGLGHANQHGTLLFGSPITSRSARLCQRTVEGIVRDVYHLHRDETVIGRETGDIVFTADPFLSRRHAMIRRSLARKESPGRAGSRWDFTLTDLDSSNGTFVAIRGEVALSHGDFVRVGQHLFRVDFA